MKFSVATCLVACAVMVLPARADERATAFVPEVNVFVKLSERTRLYLLGDVSHTNPGGENSGELGGHLDFTLMPVLRPELRAADWARERYFWMRVGYVVSGSAERHGQGPSERRGILEATGRFVLPENVWLVSRARLDLRDIGGESSRRYRLRIGVEREFMVSGVATVPYAQAETLYDTRYDGWNRQIYQAGVEVELSKTWRIETYLARQNDSRSASGNVDSLGLVLKYYH